MSSKEKWEQYLKACEYPFVKQGMTVKEFSEEQEYYLRNIESVHNGTYKPLWKQREQ